MRQFFNKIKNFIDKEDVLKADEQLAFEIFEKSLNNPNNLLFLNTEISGKKYIVPKDITSMSCCIILNTYFNIITIVNHQYRYNINMPVKTSIKMEKMFNNKVIEVRDQMEKSILNNTVESLTAVLNNL